MHSKAASSEERPTILLVANYGSDVGYAWWLMESFWEAIATKHSPHVKVVLTYPRVTTLPHNLTTAPLVIEEADFTSKSLFSFLAQIRFLQENRVRAIYFTDFPSFSWRYAAFRLLGVRAIVVHDHTPGLRTPKGGFRCQLKRLIHRLRVFSADAMVGATAFVTARHRTVDCFPVERSYTAENGVKPLPNMDGRIDLHSVFGIPAGRRVLVSVGRAHAVKGIDTILEAMAILVWERGIRDLHYLHCGDGPQLEQLIRTARRLSLLEHVTFAGKRPEVSAILKCCTVGIHASVAEVGYSLAILEMMRAGLPTVVSDHPSVSGATDHGRTGLLFRTGDSRSASDAVAQLLENPEYGRRLGEAASHEVESRFSLGRTHEQLLTVLDRVFRQLKLF